jgi:alcohol dehydrogenase class IV
VAKSLGARPLVVTGRNLDRCSAVRERLRDEGLATASFSVAGEPTLEAIGQGVELAKSAGCDLVVAVGGGSALDAGKAVAALAVNPGDPLRYLEVVGEARSLEKRPLPLIAIPTTAGTGSEVTRNAVLASPAHGVKASLRHAWMLPAVALVDPELTYDLPPDVTASTGLDALTQLIEPYVSKKANPVTDGFCSEGIGRAARSLRQAFADGHDVEARQDMALASLLGGLALANAGLGAVHGLAAPLGGLRPVPHGVACAAMLPHVMRANIRALRREVAAAENGEIDAALSRYRHIACVLTGDPHAQAEDGAEWVAALVAELHISPLADFRVTPNDLPEIAKRAASASSMRANPVQLSEAELVGVLRQSL